ncbi:hypothetical protein KIN20_032375 [Parelaphostrongylus tenuis]|uniref:Uncharacterized protein n=1 Tax=Parelaphostrongylus tenuis TaxID=148309 RepID=A0AAD5WHH1_PARTN|nr:hypothetical protein KIN20_032375 [Parelaphostrongylus tenuis]
MIGRVCLYAFWTMRIATNAYVWKQATAYRTVHFEFISEDHAQIMPGPFSQPITPSTPTATVVGANREACATDEVFENTERTS